MNDIQELKKAYKRFIQNIPTYLKKLRMLMSKDELTFSYEEIDEVQLFHRSHFERPEEIGTTYKEIGDCYSAYMGEAVVKLKQGKWVFCGQKSEEAYGEAIVLNWGGDPQSTRISPEAWRVRNEAGWDEVKSPIFKYW